MSDVFVKICGLTQEADVDAVCALKPDAVGFIFWPLSKRYVSPERAAELAARAPDSILRVGVFVGAGAEEVGEAAEAASLHVVQCYDMPMDALKRHMPVRVWQSVHLDRPDGESAPASNVDAVLIDSYTGTSPGGTGITGDWDRAARWVNDHDIPVLLAGGLTPDNVSEAVRTVRPWGVDVSSGVEAAPGRKDIEKVERFITQCRNA